MASSQPIQLGFNGGRFDARMYGRVEQARYRYACSTIENFIPTVQGPALKRSGTRFVKRTRGTSEQTRLIPFEFSRDQAYVLEISANAIQFLRNGGSVLEATKSIVGSPTAATPGSIEVTGHGYSTGDQVYVSGSGMPVINSQDFPITMTGADTFTIGYSTLGQTTGTGGTVARVYRLTDGAAGNSIPWTANDLAEIQYVQDADVMYLVHPDYPPHKLVRTSDTSWTCTEVAFAWPPFLDENITSTTVYASAKTGAGITITASTAIFTSDHIGGYFKIGEVIESIRPPWTSGSNMSTYFSGGGVAVGDWVRNDGKVYELTDKNGGSVTGELAPVHEEGTEVDTRRTTNNYEWTFVNRGWGYALITAIGGGGTTATATVVVTLPDSVLASGDATKKWAFGAFSDEYGYPSAVALYEQRLWMGGTEHDPQTFWGSKTNRFEDFEQIPDEAAAGLLFTLDSSQVNAIQSMVGADALILCTRGGEYTAQSNSPDEGITADNIKVKQRSNFGCAPNVSPKFVDSALIMAQRNARRVHELIYDFNTDRYTGPDLTAMAHAIVDDGVLGIAYSAMPFRQVFFHTTDGNLAALTYVRDEDVIGWATMPISSVADATGIVESVAVIPHPDGDQDQVWLVVKRTLSAATVRWIEYFEKPFEDSDALADAFFVDGGSTYSGSAATTIYGLLHMRNEAVEYLSGGVSGTGTVDSFGKLTVASTTKIHVGFAVDAQLETLDLEAGQPPFSTSIGDRGRVSSAVFRLHNTSAGFQYGQSLDGTLDTMTFESSPFSGITPEVTLPGGYSRSRRVAVRHASPGPCTVTAIMPKMQMERG